MSRRHNLHITVYLVIMSIAIMVGGLGKMWFWLPGARFVVYKYAKNKMNENCKEELLGEMDMEKLFNFFGSTSFWSILGVGEIFCPKKTVIGIRISGFAGKSKKKK